MYERRLEYWYFPVLSTISRIQTGLNSTSIDAQLHLSSVITCASYACPTSGAANINVSPTRLYSNLLTSVLTQYERQSSHVSSKPAANGSWESEPVNKRVLLRLGM